MYLARMLLITLGYGSASDMKGTRNPHVAYHGSFSITVVAPAAFPRISLTLTTTLTCRDPVVKHFFLWCVVVAHLHNFSVPLRDVITTP